MGKERTLQFQSGDPRKGKYSVINIFLIFILNNLALIAYSIETTLGK